MKPWKYFKVLQRGLRSAFLTGALVFNLSQRNLNFICKIRYAIWRQFVRIDKSNRDDQEGQVSEQ